MNIILKDQFKMISIITCNYNLGHLLTETIDSVLNQNIDKLESIIIDANSIDDSKYNKEIIDERQKNKIFIRK